MTRFLLQNYGASDTESCAVGEDLIIEYLSLECNYYRLLLLDKTAFLESVFYQPHRAMLPWKYWYGGREAAALSCAICAELPAKQGICM